jgi:hypothetical protein
MDYPQRWGQNNHWIIAFDLSYDQNEKEKIIGDSLIWPAVQRMQ